MSICLVIKIICFYRRNCAKFERRVCSKGQGLKNREISNISRQRNDNRHRLSIHGNIAKKSAKSPIYRRNIGGEPKNRWNIGEWSHARRRRQRTGKNRWLIGKIGDFLKLPCFWSNGQFWIFEDLMAQISPVYL